MCLYSIPHEQGIIFLDLDYIEIRAYHSNLSPQYTRSLKSNLVNFNLPKISEKRDQPIKPLKFEATIFKGYLSLRTILVMQTLELYPFKSIYVLIHSPFILLFLAI